MSLLWTAFRPVLMLIVQAGFSAVLDYLRERQGRTDAKAAGRAEARAEAAEIHAEAVDRMAQVPLPSDAEAVAILNEGKA
jgi:hypothetical protein